jgi:hypothetical protein
MVIFLAVMITDVVMLDTFNAFGMPTSTTVSIVFDLLGASVAVAAVKIYQAGGSIMAELSGYINSEKALAIITGILVSVVIAFTVGTIVQYIARLIFSFNYRGPMRYLGAIYGGLAISTITYFILVKGISDSAFADIQLSDGETLSKWINYNVPKVMLYSFLGWTVVIQLLKWIFNIKILKLVVLVGTFALAMAFAGNDLVNFIGVPLAGFNSFNAWRAAGEPDPSGFTMRALTGEVNTPFYILIISGLIMIAALIFSKKAKLVIATAVDLSRQYEGAEKFDSSPIARMIVRSSTQFNKKIKELLPQRLIQTIDSRFTPFDLTTPEDAEPPAFDKIRASVNLVVASALIALGTSLKLPLSTTYVTFMVAMGTSLADRAWDRDSAVFRVSGVIAVIGGWFLTAVVAFTGAAIVAILISIGGKFLIIVFGALSIFIVIKTHFRLKKQSENTRAEQEDLIDAKDPFEVIISKSLKQMTKAIVSSNDIVSLGIEGFLNEDRNKLKLAEKSSTDFLRRSKRNKEKGFTTVQVFTGGLIDSGHFYLQMMNYKRDMAHASHFMLEPVLVYTKNNHKPFIAEQHTELAKLISQVNGFFEMALTIVKETKFENIESLVPERDKILEYLAKLEKNQIKRIKNKEVNSRNSVLFFKIIAEVKLLLLHTVNMLKSERDLISNFPKNPVLK